MIFPLYPSAINPFHPSIGIPQYRHSTYSTLNNKTHREMPSKNKTMRRPWNFSVTKNRSVLKGSCWNHRKFPWGFWPEEIIQKFPVKQFSRRNQSTNPLILGFTTPWYGEKSPFSSHPPFIRNTPYLYETMVDYGGEFPTFHWDHWMGVFSMNGGWDYCWHHLCVSIIIFGDLTIYNGDIIYYMVILVI